MGRGVSALPDRLDVVIPQDYTVRRQTVQMWCDQAACAVHEAHFIVAEICQITAGSGETRSGNAPLAQGNLHLLLLQLLQHSPSASKNITEGFEAPTAMEPSAKEPPPRSSTSGSSTATEPIAKKQKTASPHYNLLTDADELLTNAKRYKGFQKLGEPGGQGAVFVGKSVADPLKEVAVKVFYVGKEADAKKEAVRRPLAPLRTRRRHRTADYPARPRPAGDAVRGERQAARQHPRVGGGGGFAVGHGVREHRHDQGQRPRQDQGVHVLAARRRAPDGEMRLHRLHQPS